MKKNDNHGNDNDIHIVQRENGDWAAEKRKSKRALGIAPTQQEAFEIGRNHAQNTGADVAIHGRNGQIRKKNTYGKKDPFPPKG